MERGAPVVLQRQAPLYDQALKHERREIAMADDVWSVKLDLREPTAVLSRSAPEELQTCRRLMSASPRGQLLPPLSPVPSMRALPAPAPSAPSSSVVEGYGTFCTELLDAAPDMDEAFAILRPGLTARPNEEEEARAAAVTCISSHWRGAVHRRFFAKLRNADHAARHIQSAWAAAMTRVATKQELQRIHEEDRKLHTRLMYELGQDWFQVKQQRRVEVHMCSLTIPESRRGQFEGYQALQAAQITRVFRLIDPKRDVIFVAPKYLHEDLLDYYSKIMQYRGVKNPPGRFQVVVPEHMGLTPQLSLAQALLCSPKALRRLQKLLSGRRAYMIPDVVTQTELKLCSILKLPLLGAGPRNMALLASKSNAKKLAQLADLPVGPWAVDLYDEDEFFTALAGLVVQHPEVQTWLFKIEDERDARGHAYIDLGRLREISDAIRAAGSNAGFSYSGSPGNMPEDPTVVGASAGEVRALLKRHVPRKAMLCNRRVYPDFAAWLAEASRVGAVIQAVPDGILSQTSVHLQIDPDGATSVLGSSEALMCAPFVRAASWYPHTRGSWEVLQEVGLRMGRVLAAKGLVGFASIDVVFFNNPHYDAVQYAQLEREPTPAVIGTDTPVDPQQLMFGGLRSPSPEMSSASSSKYGYGGGARDAALRGGAASPPSLPESRQADYELAVQLQDLQPRRLARDPVSLMLGTAPEVGASPASRYACWVVDVDARLTDDAAALFPMQFIAQLRLEASSGALRLVPGTSSQGEQVQRQAQGQAQGQTQAGPGPGPEQADQSGVACGLAERSQRWALVSHAAMAPGLDSLSYQSVFQAVKMRGVSFDLFHNVGCVFTFLDVFHSLFSFLAVERSVEACAKRMTSAVGAVADTSGLRRSGGKAAAPLPRDAPAPPGQETDGQDRLSITDVQVALRSALRRWSREKEAA
jgi:hypothetical protein